jgi:hypothetical protein
MGIADSGNATTDLTKETAFNDAGITEVPDTNVNVAGDGDVQGGDDLEDQAKVSGTSKSIRQF